MDELAGGSERAWRLPRPPRVPDPPARLVAVLAACVLVAAALAVVPVRRAELALDRLEVALVPSDTRREMFEASFGGLAVVVRDPNGHEVRVQDVRIEVPGLLVGPLAGLPGAGEEVVATGRFVVPDCEALRLPGALVLTAARPGEPPEQVRREVGGPSAVDGTALLVACGLAPRDPGRA